MTGEPAHIVVIEDNPADVRLLRHALDDHGEAYALEVLPDGEAALRFVAEQCGQPGGTPCLIVLDLHLPRYDGIAVLRAIRQQPVLCHVRVAVLTTLASPVEESEIFALGIQLYRAKPSVWDEFASLARDLVALCHDHTAHAIGAR